MDGLAEGWLDGAVETEGDSDGMDVGNAVTEGLELG
jgi:hypothetical protein